MDEIDVVWARVCGGRVLHAFTSVLGLLSPKPTLCGKTFTAIHTDSWRLWGRDDCKKCRKVYDQRRSG